MSAGVRSGRVVVEGLSKTEIAERLVVSITTVTTHVRHLRENFEAPDPVEIAISVHESALRESNRHLDA